MEYYYGGKACNSGSSESEAFQIDDLLDFSSEEIGAPIEDDDGGENLAATAFSGDSTVTETEAAAGEVASRRSPNVVIEDAAVTAAVTATGAAGGGGGILPAELCVPTDALEELDWLTGLIDDTSDYAPEKTTVFHSVAVAEKAPPVVKTWLRGRARSKRRGPGGGFSSSRLVVFVNRFVPGVAAEAAPPLLGGKKVKKTKEIAEEGFQRRCSHCLVHKTPQWRTGPMGPKTLCNACGVRYKSGRLLPEYRPALSPTFSSDVHSNCHRKVVEIRRQKEAQQQGIIAS